MPIAIVFTLNSISSEPIKARNFVFVVFVHAKNILVMNIGSR